MAAPPYRPSAYRIKLRQTKLPTLLVEGRDDKRAFELLKERADDAGFTMADRIAIDTADMLLSEGDDAMGNRDKIMEVCREPIANDSFVAFVDRQFDGFDTATTIRDRVATHLQRGHLVMSRGHSIENYFIDLRTLRGPLRTFSVEERFNFEAAFALYKRIFDSLVRSASAVGLAARDLGMLSRLTGGVGWQAIRLGPGEATIDTTRWRDLLVNSRRWSSQSAAEIISLYQSYMERTIGADPEVLRWMCHGHIGLSTLWEGYARCAYQSVLDSGGDALMAERAISGVRSPQPAIKLSRCAESWCYLVFVEGVEAPLLVFELLGLKR